MNRYIAEGLVRDTAAGKHVLYMGPSRNETRDAFHRCAELVSSLKDVKVYGANGRERIEFTHDGGRLSFMTPRAARGHNPDVVYLDVPRDQVEETAQLFPLSVAAADAEFIY